MSQDCSAGKELNAAGAVGPIPSRYMLFTHRIRPGWLEQIPAAAHVDGTARIQTVAGTDEPLLAALLPAVEARTGVGVVINTSLNTAGRPMVDDPRDALELLGFDAGRRPGPRALPDPAPLGWCQALGEDPWRGPALPALVTSPQ